MMNRSPLPARRPHAPPPSTHSHLLSPTSHSLSPSLPDRHMTHAHGSDARHALARDYPQATRPNQEQSGPTRREREGWQKVRRTGGSWGRAQRDALGSCVGAAARHARTSPRLVPCGQGSGGRAGAYRLEHTHARLLACSPVQAAHSWTGRATGRGERAYAVPATCGGTAFEACSNSQTTGTLHSALRGRQHGQDDRHT